MGRYLIFFSYVGTSYRGMQINNRKVGKLLPAVKTVQGVLEECIKELMPANEVKIKTSSRTDANVHALCNSVHIDLVHRDHPLEFDPKIMTSSLNYILNKRKENIRILNTLRVTNNFSSRFRAAERSYVYRLAVIKNLALFQGTPWTALDCDRSYRVYPPFDLEKFLRAAEVLSGKHNFLSFTTKEAALEPDFNIATKPIKNISIRVQRGSSYMEEHQNFVQGGFEFWEVHFHSQSFLYKQIRRMMAAMFAVAQGQLTPEDLQQFLDRPSLDNPGRICALPGQGLFLKWVRYSKEDLHYEPPEISSDQEQVPDLAVEEERQIETTQISSASVTSDAFQMPALETNTATETFTEKTASECVDIQAQAGQESTILNLKDLPKTAEVDNCSELLETSTIATPTPLRHANDTSSASDLDVHKLAAPLPAKSVECNDFCEIMESNNNLENFKESKI